MDFATIARIIVQNTYYSLYSFVQNILIVLTYILYYGMMRLVLVWCKGYYFSEDSILFNFNVDGSTSAYVKDDGSLLIRFSGTVHLHDFTGRWLASQSANFSCKFVLTHVVQ